ncbi:unnamed protein product [Dovyalis caffra]|uniref:PGG domain-containing protein n=1 Tax=Dovyalis caffra TaxID=77055 RepID=A0AAV1S316_9ROSI|nr:unnamed protein product [Dovyalis caffra]
MDPRLFDAAFTGNVNALLELLQQDPLILHNVTVTTSITPLHIAALLGHAQFAMAVMQYCPRFATEVNQQGLTPIHLASANGHWEIVRDMLACKPDLAFIKDKDGKNFLHTAATRGRIQVLREVFSTESAKELTSNGETILHLAVKHNQYQALETSIQLVNQHQIGNELFNAKDKDGNTILHLACAKKEPLMVKLLVSDQTNLDLDVNVGNSEGLTPLDIVERSMISSNEDQQIQEILKQAGAVLSGRVREKDSRHSTGKDILDPVKNGMGILAALFGTACFQLGMNPPGGVWSEWATGTNPNSTFHAASVDNNNSTYMDFWFPKVSILPMFVGPSHLKVSDAYQHKPGLSISWEVQYRHFLQFNLYNAICFFLSMWIIMLLSSSATFRKNALSSVKMLSTIMCFLLVFAMMEFVVGMALVTNDAVAGNIAFQALIVAYGVLIAGIAVLIRRTRAEIHTSFFNENKIDKKENCE